MLITFIPLVAKSMVRLHFLQRHQRLIPLILVVICVPASPRLLCIPYIEVGGKSNERTGQGIPGFAVCSFPLQRGTPFLPRLRLRGGDDTSSLFEVEKHLIQEQASTDSEKESEGVKEGEDKEEEDQEMEDDIYPGPTPVSDSCSAHRY